MDGEVGASDMRMGEVEGAFEMDEVGVVFGRKGEERGTFWKIGVAINVELHAFEKM